MAARFHPGKPAKKAVEVLAQATLSSGPTANPERSKSPLDADIRRRAPGVLNRKGSHRKTKGLVSAGEDDPVPDSVDVFQSPIVSL